MLKYHLKNYKLVENNEFDLNRLNVIIGENSSGKSSVLRSFQLIKQSLPFSLRKLHTNPKDGVDFGTYSNLVPDIEKNDELSFLIHFEKEGKNEYGEFKISALELVYKNNFLKGITIFINENTSKLFLEFQENRIKKIIFDDFDLFKYFKKSNFIKYSKDLYLPEIATPLFSVDMIPSDVENYNIISLVIGVVTERIYLNKNLKLVEDGKEIDNENKKYMEKGSIELFDSIKKDTIQIMINKLLKEAGEKLKRIYTNMVYIGPIRAIGERYYRIMEENLDRTGIVNNDVSRKLYELKIDGNLESFNKFINQYFDFKVDVNLITSNADEDIFFSIEIEKDGNKKNLLDVGTGYSQLLPILYSCFGKTKEFPAIIIVEQPELHLHPKMQSDLIDFILKLCSKNEKIKFILETHSSLIINRLGKHISKGNISYENINLFIFNKKDKLEIKKTTFDSDGTINEWPIRFFSEKELSKWS